MPITIGIAITRYRLYEIDRLISRTIGWALVTGVLIAIFAATVLGLQAILAGFAQGGSGTFAVAVSTLVAYAVFQPLRRRVQRAVDRRFDRARYDGDQRPPRLPSASRRRSTSTASKPISPARWTRRSTPVRSASGYDRHDTQLIRRSRNDSPTTTRQDEVDQKNKEGRR